MEPEAIYKVLKNIGATNLYHANSVTTSCTFLKQGGLLSRGYVEDHDLLQTPQRSDITDKALNIWNDVFLDHVNIHYRGRRRNKYGPVLFKLDLDLLLQLPAGTDIRVTSCNPIYWKGKKSDDERWFQTVEELSEKISFGDFDKMLIITTPANRVDFPSGTLEIYLDDSGRHYDDVTKLYDHSKQQLESAAQAGGVNINITPHPCQSNCQCRQSYKEFGPLNVEKFFC